MTRLTNEPRGTRLFRLNVRCAAKAAGDSEFLAVGSRATPTIVAVTNGHG
jgi:hypothetical protein